MCAAWFHWNKVHPLERRAMSKFFDKLSAAKTPRIYKEYRDFIINKYRENPKQALTLSEVRRMVTGDVNSLSRVFDFQEHWGQINQQVAGDEAEAEGPGPSLSVMDPYPSGINVVRMPVVNAARIQGIATFESSGRWEVLCGGWATRGDTARFGRGLSVMCWKLVEVVQRRRLCCPFISVFFDCLEL